MATPEETAEIKAEALARAEAQEAAIAAKEAYVESFRADAEQKATGKTAEAYVTPADGPAREEYGPYDEPRVVPTSQGENQVPFRKVLFFVPTEVFDARINRMVIRMQPTLRNATREEMEPILARRAAKKKIKMGVA
jgi:hypothetical protein